LVYDGDCGFCTAAARWFDDLAQSSASIAPWQSLDLEAHGLTEAQVSTAVYWVRDGSTHRGADSVAQALQVCPRPWSWLGHILSVPPFSWLARLVYPLVARYRHRLPGATDACRLDG
jgi:predicted DCC family thiol-disulfide oxidoreductase YuxK